MVGSIVKRIADTGEALPHGAEQQEGGSSGGNAGREAAAHGSRVMPAVLETRHSVAVCSGDSRTEPRQHVLQKHVGRVSALM